AQLGSRARVDLDARLRPQLTHPGELPVLGVEEARYAARSAQQRVLLRQIAVRRVERRLDVEGQRIAGQVVRYAQPQLGLAGGQVEAVLLVAVRLLRLVVDPLLLELLPRHAHRLKTPVQ